jgi:hypothetical protein
MSEKRAQCPRCKEWKLHEDQVLNSLSRRDGKTYICNSCGNEEAFIDLGYFEPTENEIEFIKTRERSKKDGQ